MDEKFYYIVLALAAVPVVFLAWKQGVAGSSDNPVAFTRFRNLYLAVYALEMVGDWLQGPYVYRLYEVYGFSRGQIGQLFIAGFGSSMLFGTVVGSMADRFGRKLACLSYVVLYSLSCVTKHSSKYYVLMVGRVLGGTATSLLFSVFESWLVSEHFRRGFSESSLGDTFSLQVFLGNGLMAVFSGLLGKFLVENLALGPVAPFDAAIVFMVIGGVLIAALWPENYGDQNSRHGTLSQFSKAWAAIKDDRRLALLGAMQAMFEASMYTFVFLWTPALSPRGESISHGLIFACFMTSGMAGSLGAGLLMKSYRAEVFMQVVFGMSAAAIFVPFLAHLGISTADVAAPGQGLSTEARVQLLAFCVFEVCVGAFWPSVMRMRAQYVPEEVRSTVINIFRIPLNLFVCVILYNVEYFSLSTMFGMCVALLSTCMACQMHMESLGSTRRPPASKVQRASDDGTPADDPTRQLLVSSAEE